VHLVPHTTPDLAAIGAKAGMLTLKDGALVADDFSHEMSLVLELPKASSSELAVFSSCSHAGLPVILNEVQAAFPARDIAAFVGGLHLVHASDADILSVARAIAHAGVGRVYTGHCTGARAFELLSRELPDRIVPLRPGRRITL
jgi:7,8-dihydropterin-6-yl-methyl-4-(beta-D-ribofuranosyl)aminobenzene 5'-phosphate synthase